MRAAVRTVRSGNLLEGGATLRHLVDQREFADLSSTERLDALSLAGSSALRSDQPGVAFPYLARAAAMPQARFWDYAEWLRASALLDRKADSVRIFSAIVRHWPDRWRDLYHGEGDEQVDELLEAARTMGPDASLALLEALYAAHWTLQATALEPSAPWRDLALLLLERGARDKAAEVATHIHNVYVLISMQVDRRFDPLTRDRPFDAATAAARQFADIESRSEADPTVLELNIDLMGALNMLGHFGAMLAVADSVLTEIKSTNFPEHLYRDYGEHYSSFLDWRAFALSRLGRWDEAVEQMRAASLEREAGATNVSQVIDLASMLCDLGRAREALAALDDVGRASARGAMIVEEIRVAAAQQLGDTATLTRSLRFLAAHRRDALDVYQEALIEAGQLDRAARVLIERLGSSLERAQALLEIQTFIEVPQPPHAREVQDRRHQLIARRDVQAAARRVGRIEAFPVVNPNE